MSALKGLFKKPDPRAQLRTSQREVTHNVRDIEREVLALRREEAKTLKVQLGCCREVGMDVEFEWAPGSVQRWQEGMRTLGK